jgi:hypothetical protein
MGRECGVREKCDSFLDKFEKNCKRDMRKGIKEKRNPAELKENRIKDLSTSKQLFQGTTTASHS